MPAKRTILWKKQRQFLDACLASNSTIAQVQKKFTISNKMLMLWQSKPAFKRAYIRVKRFSRERGEMDLIISSAHGADLLTQQQLTLKPKKAKASDRTTMEVVKMEHGKRPRTSRARPARKPLPRIAHPNHSAEETARLISILAKKSTSNLSR